MASPRAKFTPSTATAIDGGQGNRFETDDNRRTVLSVGGFDALLVRALVLRSPFFRATMTSPTVERTHQRLRLAGVSHWTLGYYLDYLRTGSITVSCAEDMFEFSNFLGDIPLIHNCTFFLEEKVRKIKCKKVIFHPEFMAKDMHVIRCLAFFHCNDNLAEACDRALFND